MTMTCCGLDLLGAVEIGVNSADGSWTLVPSVASPGLTDAPSPDAVRAGSGVIRKDMRGDAVMYVQRGVGVTADGVFGTDTDAAVKKFQRSHGLTADGIVGAQTMAALDGLHGVPLDDAAKPHRPPSQPSSVALAKSPAAPSELVTSGEDDAAYEASLPWKKRAANQKYIWGGVAAVVLGFLGFAVYGGEGA